MYPLRNVASHRIFKCADERGLPQRTRTLTSYHKNEQPPLARLRQPVRMSTIVTRDRRVWDGAIPLRLPQGVTRSERRRFRESLRAGRGEKRDVAHFSFRPDHTFPVEMDHRTRLAQ